MSEQPNIYYLEGYRAPEQRAGAVTANDGETVELHAGRDDLHSPAVGHQLAEAAKVGLEAQERAHLQLMDNITRRTDDLSAAREKTAA